MKQLIQSYRTGELGLFDVPSPYLQDNGILMQTTSSLVSAGTEKMLVDLAKKSLLGKAKARPDLVRQVLQKMKNEGIINTLEKVVTKLDTPIPLGYSCAGVVSEVGQKMQGVSINDRVACGGAGYANHAEYNYIPANLFVKIPDDVDDIDASFVTVGSIALQGVRQAEPRLGETVAVIGLGLIGQLTVQLLKANGCRVIGSDLDTQKLQLAHNMGADKICQADELVHACNEISNGHGVDSVIITASTLGNQPVIDAGEIVKRKGRVVVVGLVGMDVPRDIYYKKELELRLSTSYGPGRYDPLYEEKGIDYPFPYVRWTEQRNFQAFLDLVSQGRVRPGELVTHQFHFEEALKAYDLLEGKNDEHYLGIVLNYDKDTEKNHTTDGIVLSENKYRKNDSIRIGMIGAGNFAKSVILPRLKKTAGINLAGLATATGVSAFSNGRKYGFEFITTNAGEIYDNSDINAVVVTTRHEDHAYNVGKALDQGKHIFIEKPLAIKENELEEISSKYYSMKEKPIIQVGFNRRFAPFVRRMRENIGEGYVNISYRVNAGIVPMDTWYQDKEIGGGRIIGEVCHFIDTCSYLAGSKPLSVYASCINKENKSIPDEDNVNIIIQYSNGSMANIGYFAYGNQQVPKEYVEVLGHDLLMQMDNFKKLEIFRGNRKKTYSRYNQDKGFTDELLAFTGSIRDGEPAIPFQSLYDTTRVTFKILESLRTGSVITL